MTMEAPLISLRGVSKVFQGADLQTHALTRISLELRGGEYVAVTGPSGAGKSTLLSILGLLETPSAGEYVLRGESMNRLGAAARARYRNLHIGFVFQSFNLVSELTVEENVELPLTYRPGSAAERRRRVYDALERVRMSHRAGHRPSQLSGGQQQRVAVARAIVGAPSLLLADEPTGNLDSKNSEAVLEILDDLHRSGTTICMVTHEPRQCSSATRVIELFDGRIVAEPKPRSAGRVA
jgi:putative ABC transport system ATP-binding protein